MSLHDVIVGPLGVLQIVEELGATRALTSDGLTLVAVFQASDTARQQLSLDLVTHGAS